MVQPKGTTVAFIGGHKDRTTAKYPKPLPPSLVFADYRAGRKEVYYRKPSSNLYVHADMLRDTKIRAALGMDRKDER